MNLANKMAKVLEETKCNIIEAQGWMKTQADKHCTEAPNYKVGDKVWLSTMNLHLTCTFKKLSERWVGPYVITKLVENNAIELKLPWSMKIHLLQFPFFILVFLYSLHSLHTILGVLLISSPLTFLLLLDLTLFFYNLSNTSDDITTDVMFNNILWSSFPYLVFFLSRHVGPCAPMPL